MKTIMGGIIVVFAKPSMYVCMYLCMYVLPVAPVAQRYHVTSDTLGREFDSGKRYFSHSKTKK